MNVFTTIAERRELLANLVSRELKIRYRGSALGFLWTLLIPLFMALIYVVFLRLLAGRGVPLADIIIGVFAWQFTVQSVNSGLGSIVGSTNLVKKVFFPRFILPLSATLANTIGYLLSLLVQFPLVALLVHLDGGSLSPWIFATPLLIIFHFLFNLALAFIMAGLNVYYRDTQHLVGVGLSAWFFVSPVMYNLPFVEQHASKWPWLMDVFMLNPIAIIVTGYRALAVQGVTFPWSPFIWISSVGVLLLLIASWFLFQKQQKDFADLL